MIRIDFSEHQIEALLTIHSEGSTFPSIDEILVTVQNQNITYGLNLPLIRQIADAKEAVRKMVIAKGDSPRFGHDATIHWQVLNRSTSNAIVPGSDRVDFKHMSFSEGVKAHQILAKKIPAQNGQDGRSVKNETVSSMGKDMDLPQGRNTYLSDDGCTLFASIDGSAFVEDGKIQIDEIYHVKGNVSYATGNIKFDGPVVIEGDVLSGFRVEARDSIYVGGNIEAASVYSHKGDVTVNYGILGKKRAKILAGGNVKCGFVQDATIGARRNVYVERYITNSTISAGGMVELTENEGLIRGGSIEAEKGISALEVGSERNVATELSIRNQGENESQNALWELSRSRSDLSMRASSLKKRRSFLTLLETRLGSLSSEKVMELEFITTELKRIKSRLEELNTEELHLQKNASKARLTREITIKGTIHKNVTVDIGGQNYHCITDMNGVKFFRFKNEILIESLLDMESTEYDIFIPEPNSG